MKKIIHFLIMLFTFSFMPAEASDHLFSIKFDEVKPGPYKGLIIGINKYQDKKIPRLENPVNDAKAMAEVLCKDYGFGEVEVLLNGAATRGAIYDGLRKLVKTGSPDDSVLIYYAGHGDFDRSTPDKDDGWWIPADATLGMESSYLCNVVVLNEISKMKAKHVLLISDSCYAGALFAGLTRSVPTINKGFYRSLYQEKSRWGITSGNKEPVPDKGTGNHSFFAHALLKVLGKEKRPPYICIQEIYNEIADFVKAMSSETPICRPLQIKGAMNGQFVFVLSPKDTGIGSDFCPKIYETDSREFQPSSGYEHEFLLSKTGHNSAGMRFAHIKPGMFTMGSPSDEWDADETETRHNVSLTRGFYMQTTEVTQEQWESVMGYNPSIRKNCDECPVENVSWDDAREFIKMLNQMENTSKYRLPTEAEWEYACRAGSATPFSFGRCLFTEQANYNGDFPLPDCPKGENRRKTVSVKSFPSNGWGLHDMHGNVWEWCQDTYSDNAYLELPRDDPEFTGDGLDRVIRGGSWANEARSSRSAHRCWEEQNRKSLSIGFRLVRDL